MRAEYINEKQKIDSIKSRLRWKHPNWPAEKIEWIAKRMLAIVNL